MSSLIERLSVDTHVSPDGRVTTAIVSDGETGAKVGQWAIRRLCGEDVHLEAFAVNADFQRKGIGGHLLSQIVDEYAGVNLSLNVVADNHVAYRMYEKAGFQRVFSQMQNGNMIHTLLKIAT